MSRILNKKRNKPKNFSEMESYTCRWCGNEKSESAFFKCSIDNNTPLCKKCIIAKYEEILAKSDKVKALFACCHHLDVPFVYQIYQSLGVGEGINIYIKYLNLPQYKNKNAGTFEDGLINCLDLKIYPTEQNQNEAKQRLDDIIKRIEEVRNDL